MNPDRNFIRVSAHNAPRRQITAMQCELGWTGKFTSAILGMAAIVGANANPPVAVQFVEPTRVLPLIQMPICEDLLQAEGQLDAGVVTPAVAPFSALGERFAEINSSEELVAAADVGLRICRKLHGQSRSFEAIPIARAFLRCATRFGDTAVFLKASAATGILSADSGDFAGAIEFHGRALAMARESETDIAVGQALVNIGNAFSEAGHFDIAAKSYLESIDAIVDIKSGQYCRFSAMTNLAKSLRYLKDVSGGLVYADRAMAELQLGTGNVHVISQICLHQNFVRLLIAAGRHGDAEYHAQQAMELAAADGGKRCLIVAAKARAVLDLACGNIDIALTRLERALEDSRTNTASLGDTLAYVIRAEELAGQPEKAVLRLRELSALVHERTVSNALRHLSLGQSPADIRRAPTALEFTEARLRAQFAAPAMPEAWPTLSRLAIGNGLQVDASGSHGLRVGALTRLLAQAYGYGPIEALEVGLAAQLHDIGLAAGHDNLLARHANSTRVSDHTHAQHCEAGAKILSDDSTLRMSMARDIARYHHCWWNGNGYPAGIVGTAIPIHARMCAITDLYDSLLTDCPGASTYSMNDALQYLERVAGTQLDPALTHCFTNAIRSEAYNEGLEFETDRGLDCFYQLIEALTNGRSLV